MATVQRDENRLQTLTSRQREVCRALARGRSNKQIAAELRISVGTVQNHLHAIFKRLGLQGRGQVMAEYWRHASVVATGRRR